MPKFVGADRTTPMVISYPRKIRQTLKFLVDESWSFGEEEDALKTESLDYKFYSKFADNVYTETYSFESLKDHMAAETFSVDMKKLEEARDNLDTTIQTTISPPSGWETWSDETWTYVTVFGLAIATVISLIFLSLSKTSISPGVINSPCTQCH